MTPFAFAVLALAAYRLACLLTQDKITDPLRRAVYRRAPVVGYDPDGRPIIGGPWAWCYELVSCPACIGVWAAFGVYGLWAEVPDARWPLTGLAVAGGQAFLASR